MPISNMSLMRSAWRAGPVFAKIRPRWVFKVFSLMPSDTALFDAVIPPPTRSRTRLRGRKVEKRRSWRTAASSLEATATPILRA
ncbi:hypothetical protein MAXJ12_21115 [Mesorhizobium alhagi CCNWXJ12-2]|uniref:Uncharacterized protein n=1 Tax=Mesorhizobium alhagi CCNWXJ12-2 TaxID=1107882 RepID=H0HVL6_9HYPH|nr:hypothetical protein MAXJ12_21115 [Mesorhizobium alhagi CCNWXJ12-2]